MTGRRIEAASAFLGAEPKLAVAPRVDAKHSVVKESIPSGEVGEPEPIKARNPVLCGQPQRAVRRKLKVRNPTARQAVGRGITPPPAFAKWRRLEVGRNRLARRHPQTLASMVIKLRVRDVDFHLVRTWPEIEKAKARSPVGGGRRRDQPGSGQAIAVPEYA